MDPFVHIFPDVYGFIVQHFTVEDFQEVTTVSPNWNEIIGNSTQMLKKVRLAFKHRDEIEKMIHNITRRYRNVSMKFEYGKKSSKLAPCLKYVESVGPKLQKLSITCASEVDLSVADKQLLDIIDLSRLKVLSLVFVTEGISNKLLSRCNSLEKLKLSCLEYNGPHRNTQLLVPCIEPFLGRNQDLLDLELSGYEFFKAFFEKDISQVVRFNLKSLKIFNALDLSLLPEDVEHNFVKFLEKQSHSLESLKINACRNYVIEHVFNKMPALKSLRLELEFSVRDMKLKLNENIIDLSIREINILDDFEKLIRSVPRLTKLLTFELTAAKIEVISRDLPDLQALLFRESEIKADGPVWKVLWPYAIPSFIEVPDVFYAWLIEK